MTFVRNVKKESNMIAIIFESLGFITSTILFLVVLFAGRRYPSLVEGNWNLIVLGFFFFALGFGIDFADEFEFANSDLFNTLETIFLAGGLLLAAVGFSRWFNFMARFLGVAKA